MSAFKIGMKSYGHNIWHFFSLLGILALGLIIAFCIITPQFLGGINKSINDINQVLQGAVGKEQIDAFFNIMNDKLRAMDWSNPIATLNQLIKPDVFFQLVQTCMVEAHIPDAQALAQEIVNAVQPFLISVGYEVVGLVATTFGSAALGYIFVRVAVQVRETKSFNIFRFIITILLSVVLYIAIFAGIYFITPVWSQGVVVILVGGLVVDILGSLFISYLTYGRGQVKLREALSFKSFFGILMADLVGLVITVLIISIFYYFVNPIAGLLLALPLVTVTFIIISANSHAYISTVSLERKKAQKAS